jgi:hypothetical protein
VVALWGQKPKFAAPFASTDQVGGTAVFKLAPVLKVLFTFTDEFRDRAVRLDRRDPFCFCCRVTLPERFPLTGLFKRGI